MNTINYLRYYPLYLNKINKPKKLSNKDRVKTDLAHDIGKNKILNKEISTYANDLIQNLEKLKKNTSSLYSKNKENVFNERIYDNVDESKIDIDIKNNSSIKEYNIEVKQIASKQENITKPLNPNGRDFKKGFYSFVINNNKSNHIDFSILDIDNNKTVLKKISNKINSSRDSISSDIEYKSGKLTLAIRANKYGQEFSVEDIAGNFANKTGLNTINELPSNAVFSINNKEFSTNENRVFIDEGKVSLRFKKKGNTNLNIKYDKEEIYTSVESFVEDYNETINFLKVYDNVSSLKKMRNEFRDIVKLNRDKNTTLGIDAKNNGELTIDKAKFKKAIDNDVDSVKELFSDENNIFKAINSKIKSQENKPMSTYMNFNNLKHNYNYTYYNVTKKHNPYKYIESGMMFDKIL